MPQSNRTRSTQSFFGTAFSLFETFNTFFITAIYKIFIMNIAMTINAKRYSIRNIETNILEFSPIFNMMSMKEALITTRLASIIVSCKNQIAPFFQFITKPGSIAFKIRAIFPCRRMLADHMLNRTLPRTIYFSRAIFISKNLFAIQTPFRNYTIRPALSVAKFGSFCSIWML